MKLPESVKEKRVLPKSAVYFSFKESSEC